MAESRSDEEGRCGRGFPPPAGGGKGTGGHPLKILKIKCKILHSGWFFQGKLSLNTKHKNKYFSYNERLKFYKGKHFVKFLPNEKYLYQDFFHFHIFANCRRQYTVCIFCYLINVLKHFDNEDSRQVVPKNVEQ